MCDACRSQLTYTRPPSCRGCGGAIDGILDVCSECTEHPRPWGRAFAVFHFDGLARRLIHRLKYSGDVALSPVLAREAATVLQQHAGGCATGYDWLVPVPLHWFKRMRRGYNQTALLARQLSRVSGIPVCDALKRRRWTSAQTGLKKRQRRKNLRDAFAIRNGAAVTGRSILLIDDVITTGSTLEACTRALRRADAAVVDVLAVARG